MLLPRVLLVDDDASIRRLVELSLDGLAIELLTCASVAEARSAMARAPVQLLITDLMMPGESGADLLQSLSHDPALRGDARVVVASAGISPELRRTLAALGVWRFLPKPFSIQALEACVTDALAPSPPLDEGAAVVDRPATEAPLAESSATSEAAAIARHFAGDAALFAAFKASCLPQFGHDLRDGDRAVAAGDAPSLRRLAHSLKSVLRTLGHDADADGAARLEAAAAAGDWSACAGPWAALRDTLQRLAAGASGRD